MWRGGGSAYTVLLPLPLRDFLKGELGHKMITRPATSTRHDCFFLLRHKGFHSFQRARDKPKSTEPEKESNEGPSALTQPLRGFLYLTSVFGANNNKKGLLQGSAFYEVVLPLCVSPEVATVQQRLGGWVEPVVILWGRGRTLHFAGAGAPV